MIPPTSSPTSATSAVPKSVRADLADSLEDIGSAMGLLREAITDIENGHLAGGKMCAADALDLISALETRFSTMSAMLAMWADV